MDNWIKKLLQFLIPFFPLWVAMVYFGTSKILVDYINILWIPIALYYLISRKTKVPNYLVFLLLFTFYHLTSIALFDLVPPGTSWISYILADDHVGACALLFIIENTSFKKKFMISLNRSIFLVVMISFLVSIIQIKFPSFFVAPEITEADHNAIYLDQNRCFSIFSWTNINSNGVSFPILIAILVSVYDVKDWRFPLIFLSGVSVSFLTKARYVMLSTILAFSQLVLITKLSLKQKVYFILMVTSGVILLIGAANYTGYSIQDVIDDRILEKNSDMASANTRILSYIVFMRVFPDHPFLGVGPKTRSNVIQLLQGETPIIHIGYLSYLYYYGISGCLFLFISMYFLVKRAFIVGKSFGFWGSFFGILTFYLANATFVYFNFTEIGVVLAIIYIKYFNDVSSLEITKDEMSKLLESFKGIHSSKITF